MVSNDLYFPVGTFVKYPSTITYVSICSSELDEDVGDCDGNFVKRPFSSNKTGKSSPVTKT